MTERVILLHGVWLRAMTLARLARRLERAGYAVERLDYASVLGGSEPAIEALRRRCSACGDERIHFVGHSLGGLVALEALRRHPSLARGRVVCLGSPLRGSRAARVLCGSKSTRWVVGRSGELLCRGVGACTPGTEVGVVAGRMPVGLGFFARLPRPHDGTVAVEETRAEGLSDHCLVPTTHTGLLFSDEAARQTIAFLRTGHFEPAAAGTLRTT